MSNLATRLLSAAALIPCVLAIIFAAPDWFFTAFIALLAGIVGFEYSAMALADRFPRVRLLVAALSSACALALAFSARFALAPVCISALCLVLYPGLFMFCRGDLQEAVAASGASAFGTLYAGFLSGFLVLIRRIEPGGSAWIFTLFAAAVLSDTGAYAAGRALGKRKLFPRISPAKTWAGGIGGLVGTLAGIALAKALLEIDLGWTGAAVLWLPLGAAFQFGDLLESFLKRGFGVKDSGGLIPGHGGLFDRIDSLLLGAPVLYLFSMLK